jgi:two-component system, sensor histidine kinase
MNEDKAKILIVDDVPENLVALEAILSCLDQTIVRANSGRNALKALLDEDFAVVLLDVQMPDMDGFETASLIRGRNRSRHTPIIFVTAMYTTETHASLGYNIGAVDYIFKPVMPDVLRAKVQVFVDLHRKNLEIKRQDNLIRDIQRQELEEKLRLQEMERQLLLRTSAQLQESNRLKSEFLANMSHEIRTPMNGVVGMAELLLTTKLEAEQREMATVIRESGQSLLALINDILDISKIEAGKMQLELIDFDLPALIQRTVEILVDPALQKGVSIRTSISEHIPKLVNGDPLRVRQILVNLLSNAIKFTDEGSVNLEVTLANEDDLHQTVTFSVADTGIGISEERLPSMFMPFTQGDSSTTRKYGGTGLGLSISKRLCDLMGGDIQVRKQSRGACFFFTVPFIRISQAGATPAGEEQPTRNYEIDCHKGIKILLAEDSPTNQRVTLLQLKKLGLTAEVANTGIEAVRAFQREKFAMIFMDCQMPEMDGFGATRKIRLREAKLNTHTPIIGLTAQAMEGDRERCLEAGMDDYISKPASLETFRDTVQKWIISSNLEIVGQHLQDHRSAS